MAEGRREDAAARGAAGRARRFARLLAWCALFLLTLAAPARADGDIVLDNLVLDNHAGAIRVRFDLSLEEPAPLEEALRDGIGVTLVCEAELFRQRFMWFDADCGEASLTRRLGYDSLTREYLLADESPAAPRRDKDLPALLRRGWSDLSLNLGPFHTLRRGESYYLEIEASLELDEIPEWLKRSLFFWSWEMAPTLKYRMDFPY